MTTVAPLPDDRRADEREPSSPGTADGRVVGWAVALAETVYWQTAASNPPPNSGTFPPMVMGMTPAMGPPFAAEAGVASV